MTAQLARQYADGSKADTPNGVNVANLLLGLGNLWDCIQTLGIGVTSIVAGTTTLTQANAGLVLVDASSGNVILNLPLASAAVGAVFQFKRLDTSGNSVTINRAGGDTIDGATALKLLPQRTETLRSDSATAFRRLTGPGVFNGLQAFSGNNTLTAAAFDRYNYLIATPGTITLPPANSAPPGSRLTLYAVDVVGFTIQRAGTDTIYVNGGSSLASFALSLGESVTLVTDGNGQWFPAENGQRSIGAGQTPTDVSASRAQSTTYTNSTGRPIVVQIVVSPSVAGNVLARVNGIAVDTKYCGAVQLMTFMLIVPPGLTYDVIPSGATFTIFAWYETK